ncbi:MAG: 4Fe-4S binding protein [Aeromicrobium sp.]
MTYVITQQCCNDAACVPVCPVNCIHPTPDEPDYGTAEMLYIDPAGCIDCGACLDVCPVDAIEPDYDLPPESLPFIELNAAYFQAPGRRDYDATPYEEPARHRPGGVSEAAIRVAVVGTGPAASYAVQHLLGQRGLNVEIDVFEKLLTPSGLVRFGVAPDHQSTKQVNDGFGRALRSARVRVFLGVTVGKDIGVDDLAGRYHAVIHGFGAPQARRLGVAGEDLPGSHPATDFVAWYNGHPDLATAEFDTGVERAVVIGNGNVALDVARLLALDPERRRRTDMADHALDTLAGRGLSEIRVIGRRGADMAAFTAPELLGLIDALGPRLLRSTPIGPLTGPASPMDAYKRLLIERLPIEPPSTMSASDGPVVVLDFCRTPVEVVGRERVEGVRWSRTDIDPETGRATKTDEVEQLSCGLVISAIGSRAVPIDGLPYDEERGVVPNDGGRVVDPASGSPVVGAYVTGWAKRGPQGSIGTNRHCARETTEALLDDFFGGVLREPRDLSDVAAVLPYAITIEGWTALDAHERAAGRAAGRPRVKVVDTDVQRAVIEAALAPDELVPISG